MEQSSEFAAFLRSRRAALTPEQVGLPPDSRVRRVPGLRRDEVARLAGVSVEYYTRLEQGRVGSPSDEVIASLARALRLDDAEREHLANLVARRSMTARRAPTSVQRVRPGLYLMLQTLDHVPAFILGRRADVLASNRLAREVLTDFEALPANKRNLARYYLLDPTARERVIEWDRVASETVAMLRLEAGRYPNDRQLADLIGELTVKVPEFAAWWNDHRVLRATHGPKHYHHPVVGDLHFSYESFHPLGDDAQTLAVFTVEPNSPTAEALQLLASWTAPRAPVESARPTGEGAENSS